MDRVSVLAPVIPLPPPRQLLPMATHEDVVTVIVAVVFLACSAIALRIWRTKREPIGLFLLLGGCLAVLQEPMVDVLGNIWVRSHLTVFETFGRPMPLWAVLAYGIFWGFQPFALYMLAKRGFTMRTFRLGIAACFLLNLLIEWPTLAAHIYLYYGRQPFRIFGFPLIWLFINCTGMIAVAVAINAGRRFLTGSRVWLAILVPPILVPAGSLASGLAVMSVLQSPAAPAVVLWLAAVVTAVIALVLIELGGRTLAIRSSPLPREYAPTASRKASSRPVEAGATT
jgi:hypothetical protein